VGAIAIALAIGFRISMWHFLVALAFAVAASANLARHPYSRFSGGDSPRRAPWGLATGLVGFGVDRDQSLHHGNRCPHGRKRSATPDPDEAALPVENPGIVSIPSASPCSFRNVMSRPDRDAESKFIELAVPREHGLGSEKASAN